MTDTSPILLWDVDGTLLRNGINAGDLYQQAIELTIGRVLEVDIPRVHGKTDGQIIWEALASNGLDARLHTEASAHLDALSLARHLGGSRREIAPGITRALTDFAARGFTNGILTGNSEKRTRYKLEGAALDVDLFDWQHSYFGDVAPLRSEITVLAAKELTGRIAVIIGDTPADGVGAAAAGFDFVAVATGFFGAEELRKTNAVLVVDDVHSGYDDVLHYLLARAELSLTF